MKLLILSDDFTGALDTGVQLSSQEIPTTVYVTSEDTPIFREDSCEVLVVNTETRHLSYKDAYLRTKRVLDKYATPGHYVYIKTDSALRGNIPAALQAALDTCGAPLMFVPAFPSLGRTTKNAVCYINGQLLEHSVFRNDPRTPTLHSSIPEIFKNSEAAFRSYSVPYNKVSSFSTLHKTEKSDVYIFDCETNEELSAIGAKLSDEHFYGLTAGCAGFASTFAAHIPFNRQPLADCSVPGPALFISGSANAVTLAQLAYAKDHGCQVLSLADAIYACYTNKMTIEEAIQQFVTLAGQSLSAGTVTILAAAGTKEELRPIIDADFHEMVAKLTSNLVKSLLEQFSIEKLSVFGGDMVAAILKELHCSEVTALGEVTTGVPLCTFMYQGRKRYLVTKSGGFGAENTILTIDSFFKK